MMKLLTKAIEQKLRNTDMNSSHSLEEDVIVKFFNPYGVGTWLIVPGEQLPDGDWNLYGYCNSGTWEWGTVLLSELEKIRIPMFNGRIERDRFNSGSVAELARA